MSISAKRGKNAAISGRYGEDTIESLMICSGFPVCDFNRYDKTTPMAVRQYPAPHPFRPKEDRAGKNDFMLFTGFKMIYCQVKNQNTSGTCDEKLAFAFDIARFGISELHFDEFALILLGTWWPSNLGIIEYAERKCREMEMLAQGVRNKITARVIMGPKEVANWLCGMPKKTTGNGLFYKHD